VKRFSILREGEQIPITENSLRFLGWNDECFVADIVGDQFSVYDVSNKAGEKKGRSLHYKDWSATKRKVSLVNNRFKHEDIVPSTEVDSEHQLYYLSHDGNRSIATLVTAENV